jgi:hypothetical protein
MGLQGALSMLVVPFPSGKEQLKAHPVLPVQAPSKARALAHPNPDPPYPLWLVLLRGYGAWPVVL